MPINPVTPATNLARTSTPAASTSNSTAGLSQTDFLNLLVAQLQNQDPLNPVSSSDFLSQTAQFSTLQGINQLNTNITNLLSLQQLTQSADLIGKKVSYTLPGTPKPQSAIVTGVNDNGGTVQLVAGSNTINLNQVTGIQAA
jgi:flagellar basal-body rod modification protein FlgD